jgi:hypothetical protein
MARGFSNVSISTARSWKSFGRLATGSSERPSCGSVASSAGNPGPEIISGTRAEPS